MKKNVTFIKGVAFGLTLGIFAFIGLTGFTSNEVETETAIAGNSNPAVDGSYVSLSDAAELIADYQTDFVEKYNLPANTTIGGVIGKSELNSVCGFGADQLIKFRFYVTQDATGADQIGLLFYKKSTATEALKTGSASFCPVMCD